MSKQSSKETRQRAKDLSAAIGSYHVDLDIDEVYNAQRNLIVNALNFEPKFKVEGGSVTENLTLQNIQARSRMVTAYEFAQILPVARNRPGGGSLLVVSRSLAIKNCSMTYTDIAWKRQCWRISSRIFGTLS